MTLSTTPLPFASFAASRRVSDSIRSCVAMFASAEVGLSFGDIAILIKADDDGCRGVPKAVGSCMLTVTSKMRNPVQCTTQVETGPSANRFSPEILVYVCGKTDEADQSLS